MRPRSTDHRFTGNRFSVQQHAAGAGDAELHGMRVDAAVGHTEHGRQ